jgi:hypothetical protein
VSAFLGQTAAIFGGMLIASDERNAPPFHQWAFASGRQLSSPWGDGVLWPNSRGLGQGVSGGSITGDAGSDSGIFELYPGFDESGGRQMKKLTGQTLDSTGAALGSCVVEGFVTATDVSVGKTTSDTGGYYELPTPYAGAHYIVAYKAGSPDVAGTTANNLVPA